MNRVLFLSLLLLAFVVVGCSSVINKRPPDNSAPFVKATVPGDSSSDVPTNQRITIFFSEKVDIETAEPKIELLADSSVVTGIIFDWTAAEDTVVLVLPGGGNLSSNTNYTVTINDGYMDVRENMAIDSYSAYFSTGSTTVPSSFSVEKVLPVSNSINLKTYAPLLFKIFFTDEINPAFVTSENFKLVETASGDAADYDIVLSLNMHEVTLITKDDLLADFQYTLTVASTVSNNRIPATTLGNDFTAYYTTTNYSFQDKNSSMLLLFNSKESSNSTSFKAHVMGKLMQGESSSKYFSQKTK